MCAGSGTWQRMPWTLGSALSRSISASRSSCVVSAGRRSPNELMPTFSQPVILRRTETWLAPSSPTRITVSPGRGLPAATRASTSALVLSSSCRAIALPSMICAILRALRVVLVDPFGRGGQRAERVEVETDSAVLVGELFVQGSDQLVRSGVADKVGQRHAVLLHHAGGSADAAALREAEQALDAGGARDAEADRHVDAARPLFADPLDDRVVVEGELGHDQRHDPPLA